MTQILRSQKVGAAFAMTTPHELRTDRLRIRRWIPADLAPFATLNADPRVTEYLPRPLSQAESDALVARIETHFDEYGFGLWAVESFMQRHSQGSLVSPYLISNPTSPRVWRLDGASARSTGATGTLRREVELCSRSVSKYLGLRKSYRSRYRKMHARVA